MRVICNSSFIAVESIGHRDIKCNVCSTGEKCKARQKVSPYTIFLSSYNAEALGKWLAGMRKIQYKEYMKKLQSRYRHGNKYIKTCRMLLTRSVALLTMSEVRSQKSEVRSQKSA